MNNIKYHESFFKDFSDVELKIIKRKIQDVEHISFVIFCHLKQKDLPDKKMNLEDLKEIKHIK